MKIEKVCRYVPVVTGLKSEGVPAGSTTRHMLLSIPRIKWLEGGETEFYHKYKSPDADPFIENPSYSAQWVQEQKAIPISERELQVEQWRNDGMSHSQIAQKLGIERGSVNGIINRIRVKRAYQALKKDEPDA